MKNTRNEKVRYYMFNAINVELQDGTSSQKKAYMTFTIGRREES
jgi:hypothetical protein